MKKRNLLVLSLIATLVFVSCNQNPKSSAKTDTPKEVATADGDNYNVDSTLSNIHWKAYHAGGLRPRFGTIATDGAIKINNNKIVSGSFTIYMTSIKTDKESVNPDDSNGKNHIDLDNHLKNEDFFEVSKYPLAKFELTEIKELQNDSIQVFGNLTLKDKTLNVNFPAKTIIANDKLNLEANFTINRKDWGITYLTEGDPRDWIISNNVDLKLNILAKK